jgi:hypothetical protein
LSSRPDYEYKGLASGEVVASRNFGIDKQKNNFKTYQ